MKKEGLNEFQNSVWLLATFLFCCFSGHSQTVDSLQTAARAGVEGSAAITTNGISAVPKFSFDKPAVIYTMSVHRRRLSFAPDVRFSDDLKKAGAAFWWRYKILPGGKFRLSVGAHPAINYSNEATGENGKRRKQAQYFLGAEAVPSYILSKRLSFGFYFLYARGLPHAGLNNVHFWAVNSSVADIYLFDGLRLTWAPEFYYLKIDEKDGFYFTSTLTLSKNKSPLSLQSTMNKVVSTRLDGRNFVWNLAAVWGFRG